MTIRDPEKFVATLWDWECLDGCFPRDKISPTDLDCGLRQHLTEINGFFLLLECKLPGIDVQYGQKRTHDSLLNTGAFTVIIIHGNSSPIDIQRLQIRTAKKPALFDVEPSLDSLRNQVKRWSEWADNKPDKPSDRQIGDIEWFNERAAILEYDGKYSRDDADEKAIKMMVERSVQLDAVP